MNGYSVTLNSDKNEVTIKIGWHDFYQKSHHPKPFSNTLPSTMFWATKILHLRRNYIYF